MGLEVPHRWYLMKFLQAQLSGYCGDEQVEELEGFHTGYCQSRPSSCENTPPPSTSGHAALSMDIQDFKLLKPISRGSFGRVYLCEKKTTKDLFAIKVSNASPAAPHPCSGNAQPIETGRKRGGGGDNCIKSIPLPLQQAERESFSLNLSML